MHPVVFTRLDAHVPRPEGVDTSFRRFNSDAFLKDHQRLVALADKPLVGFPDTCGVGCDIDTRPESWMGMLVAARWIQVWGSLERVVEDSVEPVEGCLDVEVVPKTVTDNEGVWFLGFLGGEKLLKTQDFRWIEREAEHHFNDQIDGLGARE